MRILDLEIDGFRGIQTGRFVFPDQVALVGPNGSGKSTITDALSLALGRQGLVRELTEHDFTGSRPQPQDRIRIVATLGGFPSNSPDENQAWFRSGRSVEQWWDPVRQVIVPEEKDGVELCTQIGFAARFDHEDLAVKQLRFFQQHGDQLDPFDDKAIDRVPETLLNEVGYFVLPARRTWAATISFGSMLFRKAIATLGGVPAESVLQHVDDLRNPTIPIEEDEILEPLVGKINTRLARLVPGRPKLQLRVTATDSDSFLKALVPHYRLDGYSSLPAARHGTGLISLQTLVLLVEIGLARTKAGQSFILALEEPELHIPPGLQRRLIGDSAAVSDQIICTTHAPRVAAFFEAGSIQVLNRSKRRSDDSTPENESDLVEIHEGRPLAPESMVGEPNALVQLYTDDRTRLVEALMFPRLLVPEGRIDFEWLRLLLDVVETGKRSTNVRSPKVPPYGSVVGVVPTRNSAVRETFMRLRALHDHVFVLVDGDSAGDDYIRDITRCDSAPCAVLQWPVGWAIEDAVCWCLEIDADGLLEEINGRLHRSFGALQTLLATLKNSSGKDGGLKSHYMAHEDIAGAMRTSEECVGRAETLLDALACVALGKFDASELVSVDASRTTPTTTVCRFRT